MILHRVRDGLPLMNLVSLRAVPILQQLHLEERLLRSSSDNWCIINDGTNRPNIVMGISGRPSELIDLKSVLRDRVPVIRRFSGGGTVIVDDGTIFVTFICNKDAIPGLQPYPHPLMSWTGQLYKDVLHGFGDFHLQENDYAIGSRKFGGNAQSITKNRWVHHTSFLWDYDIKNMEYLKIPSRAPKYRSARPHVEFLCRMTEYVPSRSTFIERTIASLGNHFSVKPIHQDRVIDPSNTLHSSSKLLTRQELEEAYSSLCEKLHIAAISV
ncbi:putative lipoate-protein ligase A isoform X2 [Phoenix dactylifera]|uniref:Lipoate-protein ligase A isoform X2 n=1 Tax=Phoenix dactylifera TaxID=42345 RepID=A0A8B7CT79_PHODC|nr:putative lipoate-protein ligase A isoform X2 [Phoenix dactylifera]